VRIGVSESQQRSQQKAGRKTGENAGWAEEIGGGTELSKRLEPWNGDLCGTIILKYTEGGHATVVRMS